MLNAVSVLAEQDSTTEFSGCVTLTQGHRNIKRGKRTNNLLTVLCKAELRIL